LFTKVSRPWKESVGSVNAHASSYSSMSMSPDHRYCLSSKSARIPSRSWSGEILSNSRTSGLRASLPPMTPFTSAVSPETTDLVQLGEDS